VDPRVSLRLLPPLKPLSIVLSAQLLLKKLIPSPYTFTLSEEVAKDAPFSSIILATPIVFKLYTSTFENEPSILNILFWQDSGVLPPFEHTIMCQLPLDLSFECIGKVDG
jgi:hypothetical protein